MIFEVLTVGPIDVNCILVYCEKHRTAIIVDPGDSAKRIIHKIESLELIPKLILNTHCHADHTGGIQTIKEYFGIPFLCHEDEVQLINSDHQLAMAEYLGLKPSPLNDAVVKDGEIIELCEDITLKVIHTPGHSPGGICLYGDGKLISGDTLFKHSIGRSDLQGGDHNTLVKSIADNLLTLPDETVVYPGHGDLTTIGEEKAYNPFLRQLEGYA